MLAVLHTWGRDIGYHPHVHFLVPAGGIDARGRWTPTRYRDFLVPVKALSPIFRAKFRDGLAELGLFDTVPPEVWKKNWVVHCEPAGQGPELIRYLARYIHRVALTNLATSYRAPKRACTGCHLRSKCMRNPAGSSRQVRLFHGRRPGSLTDAMKQKIDTPEGRRIYGKRLGIVEPVFSNIRAQKRMDRFTSRGRDKVDIQRMLYCLVHNIEKILHFGTSYATATT